MKNKKYLKTFSLFIILMMSLFMVACGREETAERETSEIETEVVIEETEKTEEDKKDEVQEQPDTRIVTDMYGREVEIPTEINSIICNGSGALRLVSYLQATDLMVGVEEADKEYESSTKRDYAYINYEKFKDMPVIGKGGGTAYTAYPEEIIKVMPDVILTTFVEEAAEQLQNETGIPVVSIRTVSANFIGEDWYQALRLTADITGTEDRCESLLAYIDELKDDLKERSAGISEDDKPSVYTGAVTFSGAHGFAGTYANFGPFMAIDAKNVADETGEKAAFDVDLEKVLVWDPDIIFLDPANMNLVNDEYNSNPDYFNSLSAVQNDEVYTMPSFNNYSTNVSYSLINAYHAGKVLYPEKFDDIDLKTKGNEILNKFLDSQFFDEMEADGLYYGKIKLGE